MKSILLLSVLLLAPLGACKSSSTADATARCTCGSAETDFEGCTFPACMHGERNPDNPACVCGPLKLIGGK